MKPTTSKPFASNRTWNKDKSKYKKNYGSLQEGHGLAFLQKESYKREYISQKRKEEAREGKQNKERLKSNQSQDPIAEKDHPSLAFIDKATPEDREAFDALPMRKRKLSKLKRAQKAFHDIHDEKAKVREEKSKKRVEIEEKRKKYKEKKLFKNKKMSQKTRKGQPLMKARMELLLNSIEETIARERR